MSFTVQSGTAAAAQAQLAAIAEMNNTEFAGSVAGLLAEVASNSPAK